MSTAPFVYPFLGGGGGGPTLLTDEYVAFLDSVGGNIRYGEVTGSGGYSEVATAALLNTTNQGLATDGDILLNNGTNSNTQLRMLGYNGATGFNTLLEDTHGGTNPACGLRILPEHQPGYAYFTGSNAFSADARSLQYSNTPTYSFTNKTTAGLSERYYIGNWDLRKTRAGEQGYGDIIVQGEYSTYGGALFSVSGVTMTREYSNATSFTGDSGTTHVNRDTGEVYVTAGASSVDVWEIDIDNLTFANVGTANTTATCFMAASVNGHLLTIEYTGSTDWTARTYTRSGTTLTEIDSLSLGSDNGVKGKGSVEVSPYTNYVYFLMRPTSVSKILKVGNDGTITKIDDWGFHNGLSNSHNGIVFMPDAMPTKT